MHQLTNKEYEEYKKLCHARDHKQLMTLDTLRIICASFNNDPEAIGKHKLETLAMIQVKENKYF